MTLREWQTKPKDPFSLIIQGYSTDGNHRWHTFPIGMPSNYVDYCHTLNLKMQLGSHDQKVLLCMNENADAQRRPDGMTPNRRSIAQTCIAAGIVSHNQRLTAEQYYTDLPSYKFVISPEGKYVDNHRHYEALLAGCIPIVEFHAGILEKYRGCPVLFTEDYSELTDDYLEAVYEKMLDQEFDFSRLFLNTYSQDTQEYIKHCGNTWLHRHKNFPFYN